MILNNLSETEKELLKPILENETMHDLYMRCLVEKAKEQVDKEINAYLYGNEIETKVVDDLIGTGLVEEDDIEEDEDYEDSEYGDIKYEIDKLKEENKAIKKILGVLLTKIDSLK